MRNYAGLELAIDLICLVIGIVAVIIYFQTALIVWMWVALIFGGLCLVLTVHLLSDGFDITDLFD